MQTVEWQGKPVGFPSALHGMPLSFYHGANAAIEPSISSSGLRTIFSDSPADYWAGSSYNAKRIEKDESSAFVVGRAAHHLLLGEKEFNKQFAIRPSMYSSWQTKEAKAWRENVQGKGYTVLTPDEAESIRGMADAILEDPVIKATGVLNGDIERSLFWKEPKTGIWLKARPDVVPSDKLIFADLKTTTDVSLDALQKAIQDFRYDMQGALLRWIVRELLHVEMQEFVLVFVTKKPPYLVQVVTLKPHDLDEGEKDIRVALDMFARCFETKTWPGPNGTQHDAQYVEFSEWARKRAIARREELQRELEGMKI